MSTEYAIIVKNKTRLELLIERFNTKAQAATQSECERLNCKGISIRSGFKYSLPYSFLMYSKLSGCCLV